METYGTSNQSLSSLITWEGIYGLYRTEIDHTPHNGPIEWAWKTTRNTLGELHLLVAFYMTMNLCYMIGALFFSVADRRRWWTKRKIQPKYATTVDYKKCLQNLLQNYILIILPLCYITWPGFSVLQFSTLLPLPDWGTWTYQMLVQMVCEDFAHYWLHRLLHTPWLYQNIHKVHHTYSSPFGLAAAYAHPVEVLILGFPTFFGGLLLRPHFFTFLSFVLYRQMEAVLTHSGYDLPTPLDYLPFYGGTEAHDYHHKSFIFNYGSRFTFMDKICGTFKEPKKSKELKE
eukprot:TRINITY_DN828_c0_g1_i1.p1 TRINITY_DN828_c0_g1~~TRINITY_DN828_c0_g1_i1.p1  ORF type:complete len:287 (-),score=40.53 TRINITY_DN828_c0_g1_i1:38-898(-)